VLSRERETKKKRERSLLIATFAILRDSPRDVIPSALVPSQGLERAGSIAIYIVA